MLTLSDPQLFIGMLIGGAVPFLFSSMTIRAVGRAAFLIVKECRIQFRDKEIWAGTKKPDYGRVVAICTGEAQKELVGPALLAMLVPMLVGFGLGIVALAGFLGGMIVTRPVAGRVHGQCRRRLGQRQENGRGRTPRPGGQHRQGKRKAQGRRHRRHRRRSAQGHRRPGHQPADQGDEHGQPADHSALILPYDAKVVEHLKKLGVTGLVETPLNNFYWGAVVVCAVGMIWAVWQSKREGGSMTD